MNLNLIATSTAKFFEAKELLATPEFRRATLSMALGTLAIRSVIAKSKVADEFENEPQKFGLVSASTFGELEITKDFLKTLAETRVARPMLFQNSLHNSTTGFLAIQSKLTGPVITLSHGVFAIEHSFENASILLSQGYCDFCIALVTETFLPELVDLKTIEPKSIAFLFASDQAAQSQKLTPVLSIQNLDYLNQSENTQSYSELVESGLRTIEVYERAFTKQPINPTLRVDRNNSSFSKLVLGTFN